MKKQPTTPLRLRAETLRTLAAPELAAAQGAALQPTTTVLTRTVIGTVIRPSDPRFCF